MSESLLANGEYFTGKPGGLPDGWNLASARPEIAPAVRLAAHGGIPVITAEGGAACVGCLQTVVPVTPGASYLFEACFKAVNGFDPYKSVFFTVATEDNKMNDGIFEYARGADGWIRGKAVIAVPPGECRTLKVQIYIKYIDSGGVIIRSVSLKPCEPAADRWVRVAVMDGYPKELATWERALDFAGEQGADIALLTESFNLSYDPEGPMGASYQLMREHAVKHRMYVSGTYYFHDTTDDRFYNNQVIIGRNGEFAGHYYKNHPYDPEAYNSGIISGGEVPVFELDFGKVGCFICYDGWFGDVAELLALKGAELVLFPAAGLYRRLVSARAADNGLWIASTSSGNGCGIWDPAGEEIISNKCDDSTKASLVDGHFKDVVTGKVDDILEVAVATINLSRKASPHNWGGPVFSSPGGRRARRQQMKTLYDEIEREYRL